MSNIDKYKADLDALVDLGNLMWKDLTLRYLRNQRKLAKEEEEKAKELQECFENKYQRWYTESFAVIKQLVPSRYAEFEILYKGDGKRKEIDVHTYNIQDWLNGIRAGSIASRKAFDDFAGVTMRFKTQLAILDSVRSRFDSTLFDIRQLVQADILDSELEEARELVRNGFVRGAGAIAGVVLEKHLAQVIVNHDITLKKKTPCISDFNDALKNEGVLDTPTWRQIQRLGDIRNLCDHNKERKPTKEETTELIDGVDKFTKTLF